MTALRDDYIARLETRSDMQDHLPFLRDTAAAYGRIVELGVRTGNSTCAFLTGLADAGSGHLWSIDIAVPDVPASWHRMSRWSFLQADDMTARARAWAPATFDVLFIDTDPHSYDGALAELHAYGPRVLPGGLILVHDTDPPAAAEPARALSEYARLRGEAAELSFIRGCHGIGVLRIV
jgi:predicted O-methyltransferase YrrM